MPHNQGRPHGQPVYTPLKSFEEIAREKRERGASSVDGKATAAEVEAVTWENA